MAIDSFRVCDREIGPASCPLIVAEMSGNHNQSLARALQIVEAAAAAGAHALKIQTYTADTMTLDLDQREFAIDASNSLWRGTTLYKLYQQAYTPWEWHQPIFERCRQLGMIAFSSPFDDTAVDFLESLNAPMYKIASFENTDLPLIRKVAATGKPVIISTGMANAAEIGQAVHAARSAGCKDLVLLKCTSTYPADPANTNILTIPDMRAQFDCQVGLSDHTMGIGVALAAVSLGATVVEKHFTLARSDGGVDSAFSLEPAELAALVTESARGWWALGQITYGPTDGEKDSLQFRRSLYIVSDMRKGEKLTTQNLRRIRPGLGLPPAHYEEVLGREVLRDVEKGTPLTWDLIAP